MLQLPFSYCFPVFLYLYNLLKIRYIVRLTEAFFKKFKAIILIGTILGFLFFLLISFFLPSLTSTTKRIGVVGRYTPDNLPEDIARSISKGLTKTDEFGQAQPDLAKSWETSDGGKTWIFIIANDLFWQDGKKLTANDINYEFSDAKFEIVDEQTIKFTLESNFSAFPVILSKSVFKKGLLGIGEYKVKKVSLVGGYVEKLIIQNKKFDTETYKFYPTEERAKLAFELGQVDELRNLHSSSPFDNWKTVVVDKDISYHNFVGIFFNTEDEKFAEKSLRVSLNYALDKSAFSENRASSPISPLSWGYNPQVKQYNLDSEKTDDIKDLEIKLSTLPNLLNTAESIKKNWEEHGAKVQIEVTPNVPHQFEVFLATVDIPKDPDQYSLWHSTQTSTNVSRYKNARIDKLLEDGRTEIDTEERKKIYIDFQRFLVEDSPAIFLYHPTLFNIIRK